MHTQAGSGHGYRVETQQLTERVSALGRIGEGTGELLDSAARLAGRLPMLGTAPPALHLALRLREAAGGDGLTGEVRALDEELRGFEQALTITVTRYRDRESDAARTLRALADGAE